MEKFVPVKISELVKGKRELVAVHYDTTVHDVLSILSKEKLMSVPVFGRPGHWISSGGFDVTVQDKQYIGAYVYLFPMCLGILLCLFISFELYLFMYLKMLRIKLLMKYSFFIYKY